MNKRLFWLIGILPLLGPLDCVLENSLTNINNWDLSACVNGFDTCFELFQDNRDQIVGELGDFEF